ncbi:MAG: hypothetical protein E2O39_16100 [Planctomycetota bacterium]|nr:MAG: hypothetical protein E2O39_16100 [Planctomycetota bacterium]
MYPHERSLVKRLQNEPFALIGVNSDKDLEKLRPRMEEENITWRSFWNGPKGTGGPISAQWNVRGWPTIYVLDKQGVIRFKNVRGEAMDEAVDELLAE